MYFRPGYESRQAAPHKPYPLAFTSSITNTGSTRATPPLIRTGSWVGPMGGGGRGEGGGGTSLTNYKSRNFLHHDLQLPDGYGECIMSSASLIWKYLLAGLEEANMMTVLDWLVVKTPYKHRVSSF